jgi:gliding motility-associated-like protein
LSFGTATTLNVLTNAANPTFLWQSDSLNLSCYTCSNPTFTAEVDGTATVSIRDGFGCTASDSLHVMVFPERFVYFPTGISVNDDGINDVFMAYGKGNFVFSNFRIYNRWGDLVFEKKNGLLNQPADGWDGRFNGKKASPGMYTFTITVHFAEGEAKGYRGRFVLLRN